jgi:hypothetical protein
MGTAVLQRMWGKVGLDIQCFSLKLIEALMNLMDDEKLHISIHEYRRSMCVFSNEIVKKRLRKAKDSVCFHRLHVWKPESTNHYDFILRSCSLSSSTFV